MTDRKTQIGIDRLIRMEWLEQTTQLILAGNDEDSVKGILEKKLSHNFPTSSPGTRGSLSKTVTILMKTWIRVPRDLVEYRDAGLELLRAVNKRNHLAVHWGMIMAAYPFWGAVAGQAGRLLRLQDSVAAGQVQRRLKEQYGERETVSRRARYVLRAFIDWGVLKETGESGVYGSSQRISIEDPRLIAWLVEASLHARPGNSGSIGELIDGPNLFPFSMAHVPSERIATLSSRLDLLRHGLDQGVLMLRSSGS